VGQINVGAAMNESDFPDLPYYQLVVNTQNDPEILKAELQDLINETYDFIVGIDMKLREDNSFKRIQ